ncbi:MAG TPA: Na+/H+ antiporter subunit C [Candidatus Binatia bacterium]|nr:Na+/H+ antiporter subunit C [Candidatus Binatia bacterium]
MELLVAIAIGSLVAAGVFLILRPTGFPVVLGLALVSHAVNLLLVSMGRVRLGSPPLVADGTTATADPLAQALVLTAIVISFGMTAFLLVLAYRGYQRAGTESVDLEIEHG